MTILHLGVTDIPYSSAPAKGKRNKVTGTQTTGDVAGWLETRYHIMEHFFQSHQADIAKSLETSVAGAIQSLVMGAPSSIDAFGSATSEIEHQFKDFLSTGEIERLGYPGIPTQAAFKGINRRMKSKKGVRRPSFVDTGLFQSSFKSWVD
jgi:hypothetical protein